MRETDAVRVDITYCVPVMNRLDDLKRTLAHNLSVVERFDGRARLIVGCFDGDTECEEWVHRQFPEELGAGLLTFKPFWPLPYWHFSWAKNAFGELVDTGYYSSLDGDNFLSEKDVASTLKEIDRPGEEVLIHHFSGDWGDGTSGRITLPARLYREEPYLNEILPRQFDEMGVILRLLARHPSLVFVSRPGVNVFEKSRICREFLDRNGIEVNHREADLGMTEPPENPRGAGYVGRNPKLSFYQKLNAAYTCWVHSIRDDARRAFMGQLESAQRAFTRSPYCTEQPERLFSGEALDRLGKSDATTVYMVNRNNFEFLEPWLAHYRALGVERFVVVDDYSDRPLEESMVGDDVFVVRPHFGVFRTSKVFWLKALMAMFQEPESWVLTVDIDEFLDVPTVRNEESSRKTPLGRFLDRAEQSKWRHAAGLMVDMMPAPDRMEVSPEGFIDSMDHYFFRPISTKFGYQDLAPIKWAFGAMWPVSFAVDVRYRLFGTIDCLRKIPVLRYHPELDLNQGFHGLTENGRPMDWDELLPPERGLLPVRHYKMARIFGPGGDAGRPFERTEQYFGRTQQNLERIAGTDFEYIRRIWQATPFKRRYTGADDFPFLGHVHGDG